MILLRFVLISIIVYLLLRSFVKFLQGEAPRSDNDSDNSHKPHNQKQPGVPKELGEYIDYEEVKD